MAEFASGLQHFSHSHMLELTSLQGVGNGECCRGCMKPIKDFAYHCQACNFFLHLSCSKIPQQISHPADSHPLHLLTRPWNYAPSWVTRCNACQEDIVHGFSFHCSVCSVDLHPSCASLPTEIKDPNHPHNTLDLCFIPPDSSKAFTCYVCMKGGQTSWSYHCFQCNYNSHVYCTQIHSLLNETSPPLNLAYADYATHPHYHSERSFSHNPHSSIPHQSYLPNSYPHYHSERSFSHNPHSSIPYPSYLPNSSFQIHPVQQQHPVLQQQQHPVLQQHPVQQQHSKLRIAGNIVAASAISGISATLFGGVARSLMNPDGDGGDYSGGFNDNSSDFGFF